jgi:energy-coupling factor transporter ATP-binding protein EcfA2
VPARAEQAAVREPAAPPACAAAPHTAGERALLARPRCLLLDEPSIGLAPKLFQDLLQPIRALQKEHAMSILLIEQNVREAPKKPVIVWRS